MDSTTKPQSLPIPFPRITFSGKVHLITSDLELQSVATQLNQVQEFGFDTETRPSFKKGEIHKVALLQLATDNDAYLIRLHHITDFRIIKAIFENEKIIKTGVAIRDDIKLLQKLFGFEPKNFVELQTLAKLKGLKNFGLKGMAEDILKATISKGPKMTNWEIPRLSEQQITYAATDAWIGLKIYQVLKSSLS